MENTVNVSNVKAYNVIKKLLVTSVNALLKRMLTTPMRMPLS